MASPIAPRTLVWVSVGAQLAGLAFDVAWHALNPTFEATTVDEMVTHLRTVHLPIYIGVVSVLFSTAWALVDRLRRAPVMVATWSSGARGAGLAPARRPTRVARPDTDVR
jgi:hypothetical protein